MRESRSREITRQFEQLRDSLVIYTRGSTAINAITEFEEAFHELEELPPEPDDEAAVADYYADVFVPQLNENTGTTTDPDGFVPTNPAQTFLQAQYTVPAAGDFDAALAVDDAGDGSAWSEVHERYHDYFRELVERFDFEDALLIDTDGEVVYTSYKGVDLGTNIHDGPYESTVLADALDEAVASNAVDFVKITDFENYQPSYGVPTAWAVSPIGDDGVIYGVLALQFPVDTINEVMTGGQQWARDGLGETGETYLVGRDYLMRSNSRRLIEDPENYEQRAVDAGTPPSVAAAAVAAGDTTLIQPVRNSAVERAFRGDSGEVIEPGYLGLDALFAYAPVEFGDLSWAIIAEIQTAEAFEPVNDFTRSIILATAGIILAVAVASLLLSQVFSRPVDRLMTGVRKVAAGDLGAEVDAHTRDEFGDLGGAFNDMSRSLRTKQELLEEQQQENERLLHNLMPEAVARRYKQGDETIAEDHQDVTVVFADLIGFEDYAAGLNSESALAALNSLVRSFDEAATRLGIDRVRTLRHGYLASCGLVTRRPDHIRRTVDFTREMQSVVERFNATNRADVQLRAGIDTGTVTSGLVGRSNVAFDMWGDAVNLAYRLQGSDPRPGVFVTGRVYDRLRDSMTFSEAGQVETRNGNQQIWRLDGESR